MFESFKSRIARIAVPAALVMGSLTMAHPAAAADWCVLPKTTCGVNGTPIASFDGALAAAAAWPDSDRIFLDPGYYAAPTTKGFEYGSAGQVEIIGAGVGQTTLTGPAQTSFVLYLWGGTGSSVHDLTIQLPIQIDGGIGLATNATAKRIAVDDNQWQTQGHVGVALSGGTLEDSTVSLNTAQKTDAVDFRSPGSVIRNSTVSGVWAVWSEKGGTVERSYLTGSERGIEAYRDTTIKNSVIHITSQVATGITAQHAVIDIDGLTMIGGLLGTDMGISASSGTDQVDVNMKNSIVRGFTTVLHGDAFGAASTNVALSYSDFDPAKVVMTGSNAHLTQSNNSNAADPGFVNGFSGNYHLLKSSPLVDAGDPAEPQGLDMDGHPLVMDGNLDGTARRDIGAYEVDGPLPADPPAPGGGDTPPSDTPPADQPPAGSAGDQQQVQGTSTSGTADKTAPLITGLGLTNKTFAVGRAQTAIAALARGTKLRYSLSEAAKVTVKIQRVSTRRIVGKLTRNGVKGANTIKFSGRIGSKALKPGRYRAVLAAIDAAGNRSSASRVSFRVVGG